MALLETARTEFPYSAEQLEEIDIFRTDGRKFKFTGKDGKEDTINGVFQLRLVKALDVPTTVWGFEEFRASQNKTPGGSQNVRIKQIANNFSKLDFIPNKKSIGIAFCPDTRHNRALLADMYFDKKYVIEGLLTENGPIESIVIRKDIELLALKRKAERQGETNKDTKIVDRMLSNLTPEQKEYFTKKFVEIENQKKAPIVAPTLKAEEKTETTNTNYTPVAIDAPKPEGSLKFFALKKEAKKIVLEKNVLMVESLKKEFGTKWNSSSKYKEIIQTQIDSLLETWTKPIVLKPEGDPRAMINV